MFGNDVDGIPYAQLPLTTINADDDDHHKTLSAEELRARWLSSGLRLLYCFLGLQASYLTWGLMQEKIMTQAYLIEIDFFSSAHHHHHHNSTTTNGLISISPSASHPSMYSVRFLNAQFLIFFCRLLAFSIACGSLVASHRRHLSAYLLHSRQPALYRYSYCSLSNILSSWAQYEALKYVSFPVQVLSKGGKMMAVMLMSVVVGGKRYKRVEWAFALSISVGIWLFLLNEEEEVKHRIDHHNSTGDSPSQMLVSGLLLLTLYLTFDSFTSNWQAALFDGSPSLSSVHMMAAVNLWSLCFTSVSLFSQSELLSALRLLPGNPALLRDLLLLATASAVGQLFVYHTIARFGAVLFTLIMTLRQVLAILLSILIFGHPLTVWGVLGITIVFSSLFTNIYLKYRAKVEGGGGVRSKNKAQA